MGKSINCEDFPVSILSDIVHFNITLFPFSNLNMVTYAILLCTHMIRLKATIILRSYIYIYISDLNVVTVCELYRSGLVHSNLVF